MRSTLDRRLARIEQAMPEKPDLDAILRGMSDEQLRDAIEELRRKIDAFQDPEWPDVPPGYKVA